MAAHSFCFHSSQLSQGRCCSQLLFQPSSVVSSQGTLRSHLGTVAHPPRHRIGKLSCLPFRLRGYEYPWHCVEGNSCWCCSCSQCSQQVFDRSGSWKFALVVSPFQFRRMRLLLIECTSAVVHGHRSSASWTVELESVSATFVPDVRAEAFAGTWETLELLEEQLLTELLNFGLGCLSETSSLQRSLSRKHCMKRRCFRWHRSLCRTHARIRSSDSVWVPFCRIGCRLIAFWLVLVGSSF